MRFVDQIEEFVHRWYQRVYSINPDQVKPRTLRLLGAIDRSAATRDLAGNPMLLTILAVIGRRRDLPRERHRVFQHAVERRFITAVEELTHRHVRRFVPVHHVGPDLEIDMFFLDR